MCDISKWYRSQILVLISLYPWPLGWRLWYLAPNNVDYCSTIVVWYILTCWIRTCDPTNSIKAQTELYITQTCNHSLVYNILSYMIQTHLIQLSNSWTLSNCITYRHCLLLIIFETQHGRHNWNSKRFGREEKGIWWTCWHAQSIHFTWSRCWNRSWWRLVCCQGEAWWAWREPLTPLMMRRTN